MINQKALNRLAKIEEMNASMSSSATPVAPMNSSSGSQSLLKKSNGVKNVFKQKPFLIKGKYYGSNES